jgi:hypothetical protein
MRTFCVRTLCFGIALLACLAYASGASHSDAEYLGGTVKSIPSNTIGTLDLNDPQEIVFRYGRNFYRLPFEKIKSYEISHSKPARRVFGRVPVPSMPWKQDQILNLSFRSGNNETGVLSFKLTGKDLSSAEWVLKSRIDDPKEAANNGVRSKLPEAWWGDRYWRTTRNAALWPSSDPEATGTK